MKTEPIEGRIGQFANNTIRGWCRKKDMAQAMQIECLIDNVSIGVFNADEPRKRLLNKGFESINHGFSISLNPYENHIRKVEIIDVESKSHIPNSPTLIGAHKTLPLVYFVHIPKTAGTSLRLMLERCYESAEVYPNVTDIKANNGLYPDLNELYDLPALRLNKLRLINGHYPFAMIDRWLTETKVVTFFREPTDRVISHMRHLQRNDKNCQQLSLDQIYKTHKHSLVNLQLRILKNKKYQNANGVKLSNTSFSEEKLIATLDRFDAFGIVEEFVHSTKWIEEVLSISFDKTYNSNRASDKSKISEKLKLEIQNDCQLEKAAYEIIKSEFYKRTSHLKK